jgi:HAD superfamily hydrolase (TIGR01549 family)
LLDLDGTLVDSNYQRAFAWYRAFRRHDVVLPMWRIHRHIGMGGDQIVAAVAGVEIERRLGDSLRKASADEFEQLRDECTGLAGAQTLVAELKRRGHTVVLASSSSAEDLDHFLDLLGIRQFVDTWTTADDVERTKPHPDVIEVALERAGSDRAVMAGDSGWDVDAAANAGIETICVITGGWSKQELRDRGAVAVFDSLVELCEHLDETPLA